MRPKTDVYTFPSFQYRLPCEYYSNGQPSPTFNRKSHDRWGARHVRALDKLHEFFPPTHWATVKFNRPEPVVTIKFFLQSLARAVGYHNRSRADRLALFGVHNIEADGTVHLHVLVRASGPAPQEFLSRAVDKFNRKHRTTITVPFFEPPRDIVAVTHYPFHFDSKDKLLFSRNLGMRFVFQCGRYFLAGTKAMYEREGRFDYVLRTLESAADTVLYAA